MRQVDKALTLEETAQRDQFLVGRLIPIDRQNVETVIRAVDALADDYFREVASDNEPSDAEALEIAVRLERLRYQGEPDINYRAFGQVNPTTGKEERGYPFFSVYAIGGQITKQGIEIRKDIDLMVVTNMWWSSGSVYSDDNEEWLIQKLRQAFGDTARISCREGLPHIEYREGGWVHNKALIELAPHDTVSTPIDITYIRSFPTGESEGKFITPEAFEQRDCSEEGRALPRLLLYQALTTDFGPSSLGLSEISSK